MLGTLRQIAFAIAVIVALAPLSSAQPASTETSTVTVTIVNNVALSDVDDVALATGNGEFSGGDQVCLTATLGVYSITFLGSGAGGAFELTNSLTGDTAPYTLDWFNLQDGSGPYEADAGLPISGLVADVACNEGAGTFTGEYLITIDQNDLAGLSAGEYSGSLIINVAAE